MSTLPQLEQVDSVEDIYALNCATEKQARSIPGLCLAKDQTGLPENVFCIYSTNCSEEVLESIHLCSN